MLATVTIERHSSAAGLWELAARSPSPCLQPAVVHYMGYHEHLCRGVRRVEVPSGKVTVIISFGEPLQVSLARDPVSGPDTVTSFVTMSDGPAVTEHSGLQHGIEVGLTPWGAYSLFGLSMGNLVNHVVELDQLWGRRAVELSERLAESRSWAGRFDLLDAVLAQMMTTSRVKPCLQTRWAWEQLEQGGGRVPIAELCRAVGWSRRHLATTFREQIGLTPKALARVLRFRHAHELLTSACCPPLVEVALSAGYYDQSHFNREFLALGGCTPTEYAAAQRGDAFSTSAWQLGSVPGSPE